MRRQSNFLLSVSVISILSSGCGDGTIRKYPPYVPNSQVEAGMTTVAVVMIEPWQNIVGDLKPGFSLTGNEAVKLVLPITSVAEDKILSAFGLGVSVGLPNTTITRKESVVKPDGEERTNDEKSVTRETKPGDATDLSIDPVDERTAAALPGIGLAGTLLEEPPVLQYQAALALYQEVKLLNRYVESAALAHGMVPYLVRLQIGVNPYASREPFDIYSRIGFFTNLNTSQLDLFCTKAKDKEACKRLAKQSPEIIPLVVTDDLESTRQSRAADVVRQLAFNLSGTVQNTDVAAQLRYLNEQLQAIVGTKLNSLSSITRLNDNTIQARFGAANDPSITPCHWYEPDACKAYDRSTINRNYFVSLLVLVPSAVAAFEPPPKLNLIVETKFRNIATGAELPALGSRELDEYANIKLGRFTKFVPGTSGWNEEKWLRILSAVTRGDVDAVKRQIGWYIASDSGKPGLKENEHCHSTSADPFCDIVFQAMWTRLASLAASIDLHAAEVDLPTYRLPSLPEEQLVLALDDGDTGTRIRLVGGRGLDPRSLAATLHVKPTTALVGTSMPASGYVLPFEEISTGNGGSDVLIKFPSLAKMGFVPDPKLQTELALEYRDNDRFQLNIGPRKDENQLPDGQSKGGGAGVQPNGSGNGSGMRYGFVDPQDYLSMPMDRMQRSSETDTAKRYVCGEDKSQCFYIAAVRNTKVNVEAGLEARSIVDRVVAEKGEGEATIVVSFKKGEIGASQATIAVTNARLVGVSGQGTLEAVYKAESNAAIVSGAPGGSVLLNLKLDQLADGESVGVSVRGERAGKPTGTLPTIELKVKNNATPAAKT